MTAIHTILGPIEPTDLGRTLMREQVLCDFYRVTGDSDQLLNDEALAVEELARLARAGGRALVECSTPDTGRNPRALRTIAEQSGLHLIMSTGWHDHAFYPPEIDRSPTDTLAKRMIRELTAGVDGTGVRAGVIGSIGLRSDYVAAQEERVLRAAARAQVATNAPLFTHGALYPVGLMQLAILREEGVDPTRVVIGHCDTYLDTGYHLALLKAGASVQFDTIGHQSINPDERRIDALLTLLRHPRGDEWLPRILLSSSRSRRSDLRAFGGVGYDYVFTEFFERLRAAGVTDAELDVMTVENARRVLAW